MRPAQQITLQVSVCTQCMAGCLPCRPAVVEDARREVSTSQYASPCSSTGSAPCLSWARLLFQLCRPVQFVGFLIGGWAGATLAPENFSEAYAEQCMSGMALASSPLGAEFRAQLAARDHMHPLLRQVQVCSQADGPGACCP